MKTFQCRVCGATFASQDDIEEDVHGTGFWCPECESFTPYAGITRIIDLSVCLETKAGDCRERQTDELAKSDLQGRLSPLRYPGGKGKMLRQLEPHFPEHIGTMVEPFAGGAAASLAMLFAGRTDRIVLNDLDPGVCAFWTSVLEYAEELLNAVRNIQGTREEFLQAKRILDRPDDRPTVELAAAFLTANQLAFSGITKAGIAGDYERRWNYKKVADRIRRIAAYKDCITVMRMDALQVIEEFYWSADHFLFIDPPYVLRGKQLYRKWYEMDDHKRLAGLIQDLTLSYPGCAKIVVTYDACPETEAYYDFPYAEKFYKQRNYSCGCSRSAKD